MCVECTYVCGEKFIEKRYCENVYKYSHDTMSNLQLCKLLRREYISVGKLLQFHHNVDLLSVADEVFLHSF